MQGGESIAAVASIAAARWKALGRTEIDESKEEGRTKTLRMDEVVLPGHTRPDASVAQLAGDAAVVNGDDTAPTPEERAILRPRGGGLETPTRGPSPRRAAPQVPPDGTKKDADPRSTPMPPSGVFTTQTPAAATPAGPLTTNPAAEEAHIALATDAEAQLVHRLKLSATNASAVVQALQPHLSNQTKDAPSVSTLDHPSKFWQSTTVLRAMKEAIPTLMQGGLLETLLAATERVCQEELCSLGIEAAVCTPCVSAAFEVLKEQPEQAVQLVLELMHDPMRAALSLLAIVKGRGQAELQAKLVKCGAVLLPKMMAADLVRRLRLPDTDATAAVVRALVEPLLNQTKS